MKSSNKLMIGSAIGVAVSLGITFFYRKNASDQIKKSTLYKEAMEAVKQNKGVIYYLGLPIEEHDASALNAGLLFSNSSNVKVKVSGPKSDGIVFITVVPDKNDNTSKSLRLDTVQLQIGKDDSKRLVVKSSNEKTSESC